MSRKTITVLQIDTTPMHPLPMSVQTLLDLHYAYPGRYEKKAQRSRTI